jgi:hypothetical protein
MSRCLLLAQSRHRGGAAECPLSGVKRTCRGHRESVAIDPKRISASPQDVWSCPVKTCAVLDHCRATWPPNPNSAD